MSYRELLDRLVVARRFGMRLGLDRMRALLDRLDAPDRRLGAVVHVGGTNGKGSTVTMIAAMCRRSVPRCRVATYTSPHLSSLRERIVIDGEPVSEGTIVAAAARVDAAGGAELTFFEQLTAIAMIAIADAGVDVTVLEVGLGGRLDATNVVDAPIAVVTGVALDHEAILGDSLDAIAGEKAGIWKPGQHAIVGASGEAASVALLAHHARAAGVARVVVVDEAAIADVPPVALPGAHQRRNAAAAVAAVEALEALGAVRVSADSRAAALATVVHPGRFEIVAGSPRTILDGAHNPHGAGALVETVRAHGERPVVVVAISADKDARAIAAPLATIARAVIATRFHQDRALAPAELARAFAAVAPGLPVETAPDLAGALGRARELAGPGGTVLVTGSLFLVGEARVLLVGAPADPVSLSDPARLG